MPCQISTSLGQSRCQTHSVIVFHRTGSNKRFGEVFRLTFNAGNKEVLVPWWRSDQTCLAFAAVYNLQPVPSTPMPQSHSEPRRNIPTKWSVKIYQGTQNHLDISADKIGS
ncbi:hypothetical protein PGTUg99_029761 [Puccinia graminis f. sp. tritici]|uniref:Uncharacterized protein n=1 Tax=Puccinia graminis f. sp. tritici TaxID=56615 RepID=A0A5B0P384_PUCGR|nr:hypothetical protein PGTUg99_029761 [Puccinia graminis f. sp. tritici]